jgi:uncharacterized protein
MRASGTFLWNELLTGDTEGAVRFYSRLLGWQPFRPDGTETGGAEEAATPHTIWMKGFEQVGSMRDYGRATAAGAAPIWLPFITVDDVDRCAAEAERLGGTVISPPFDVPNSGRFAVLKDPQGALFGITAPFESDGR